MGASFERVLDKEDDGDPDLEKKSGVGLMLGDVKDDRVGKWVVVGVNVGE